MTEQEQGIAEQYERLQYCLILEKVGQDPSMADLQLFDIEKYRHVLSSERFRDFTMALVLYASGVGCGSMLYLRRVYESVIDTIAKRCESKAGWDTNEKRYPKGLRQCGRISKNGALPKWRTLRFYTMLFYQHDSHSYHTFVSLCRYLPTVQLYDLLCYRKPKTCAVSICP